LKFNFEEIGDKKMKRTIKLTGVLLTLSLLMIGCSASFSTNTATSNAAKPSNAASNTTTTSSNTTKSNSTSTTDKSKTEIKDEKAEKPKDAKKQPKAATVPAEWIWYSDEVRGYGFSLPKGAVEDEKGTTNGVDYFSAKTPDGITVIVYAFKDKTLTKEDLLDTAEKMLNAMGETVKTGTLTSENDNFAVADADSVNEKGGKSKLNVLVATDVTDNYVMFVTTDAASYDAKKATMDMIWGSFEMYSGGN
jgi:hypothetical protein